MSLVGIGVLIAVAVGFAIGWLARGEKVRDAKTSWTVCDGGSLRDEWEAIDKDMDKLSEDVRRLGEKAWRAKK